MTEPVNEQDACNELQTIIDGLPDMLLVVGPDHTVRQANRAVRSLWNGQAVVGRPCHEVTHVPHPCQPPNCQCPLPAVLATGQTVRVTHYHPDGDASGRYVQVVASPLRDQAGQVQAIIELIRDVTEEQALGEALVRRNRELSALNAVANAMTQPMHLSELLFTALDKVLEVAGVDVGSVYLLSDETGGLELRAHLGTAQDVAQAMNRLHLDDSGCSGVIEKGKPVVIPDINVYRAGARRTLAKAGLASLVHVPLISRGTALGTMCLGTRTARDFEPEEVDLIMAIGNQIALGVENARLYEELARRDQLRGELLNKVITAQEEERKRIARDLHDDTSQALSALLYSLEAAEATCATPQVKPALSSMRQRVTQIIEGVHKLIFDLRPSMLDHLGLFVALRWYAETHLEPAGIRLHIEDNSERRRLVPHMETAIFRVVQEALNNIIRHAGARNVRMIFECCDQAVSIDVQDDGIGFDLAAVEHSADQKRGLGLVGMQERIGLLGGEITFDSTPGVGTLVSIHVPIRGLPEGERGREQLATTEHE